MGSRQASGLYRPEYERDSCGVAFVATLTGVASHDIVQQALQALANLEHRGASGADADTGDGAGILLRMPDALLREELAGQGIQLPEQGAYAAGLAFLPTDQAQRAQVRERVEHLAGQEQLRVLGWRPVPTDPSGIGPGAREVMPHIDMLLLTGQQQAFRGRQASGMALERRVYCLRKRLEHTCAEQGLQVYFPSLSTRTLVYKGMLTAPQLGRFFTDLTDPRCASPLALVHSRFSTNTFPSWALAHPYRLVAHNGEINTVRGNRMWMAARESGLRSSVLPGDLQRLNPICTPGGSDSASFDEVVELLHLAGRSLPHAMLMMVPQAWEHDEAMAAHQQGLRAFYEYHATLMQPWDGPACLTFTDGNQIGAMLDRNGLRPARYIMTHQGLVILASETGVLDIDPSQVAHRGRLAPGKMFLVDTGVARLAAAGPAPRQWSRSSGLPGRILDDDDIKAGLAAAAPYEEWLHAGLLRLDELPEREHIVHTARSVLRRQQAFGYTAEEIRLLLAPMGRTGEEPVGSMGTDTPPAVLSQRPRLLFDYFSQLFAQVTNPPIDAIREKAVTSLEIVVGPGADLLEPGPAAARQVVLPNPVLDNDALAKILHLQDAPSARRAQQNYATAVISGLFPIAEGEQGLAARLQAIGSEAVQAAQQGARFLVLSDRHSSASQAGIPTLLLTSVVHHALIEAGLRDAVGLLVEAADVREVHHVALLIGFGASAVNPYLALETVEDLARRGQLGGPIGAGLGEEAIDEPVSSTAVLPSPQEAVAHLVAALSKGLLKVMSKMGISTVSSYQGAQLFEVLGLSQGLCDQYFPGMISPLGGIGLAQIAQDCARRHARAYPSVPLARGRELETGGEYQWRRDGEEHLFDPETVYRLQHATRSQQYEQFARYTSRIDEQATRRLTLRGLLRLREGALPPLPVEEVEPVEAILARFCTGAMSYGSISAQAHETLAVAMNRLGGKSNSGEGGEDPARYMPDANGDRRGSAIHQVASGRFGVTSHYLVNATELQIKMAQGAKPGEGGQLPGPKVYPHIARTRHATPGVGLISPPPHHDIYSIEDLKQLIFDLKNANPHAQVSVKLASEAGVGTVAAGVCKAKADSVLIAGHDGGTGAAPLSSLKHTGTPWEMGLAETQQTLLANGLRDRIRVGVDGQMRTGRDVVIAALLGAEEYGFATAPLVVSGCIMMRVCHLDTCPVGIATQNPALRARFSGQPEFVQTYFRFIAEQVRQLLAALGLRSLDEAVGRTDLLAVDAPGDAPGDAAPALLDLAPLLEVPVSAAQASRRCVSKQDHELEQVLDQQLVLQCASLWESTAAVQPLHLQHPVRNVNRSVGTLLGSHLTSHFGADGLPADTVNVRLTGSAGQSLGAFIPSGLTLTLHGDANDYVGKGLSGGRLVVRPDDAALAAGFVACDNVIIGNTALYGATSGQLLANGRAGERFAVRNSGATAVVEGVGAHGCEYMTGGVVVVLGSVGRNFGAGMSGGVAYLLDAQAGQIGGTGLLVTGLEQADQQHHHDLHELLQHYVAQTGSPRAQSLLQDWPAALARFTVVIPQEYQRVLDVVAAATARAEDPDEAVLREIMGVRPTPELPSQPPHDASPETAPDPQVAGV